MSVWFAEGEVVRQCVELVLSAAVGVLLYYVPFRILKRRRSVRGMTLLEPTAQATAAGLVIFSCFAVVLPRLLGALGEAAASPSSLFPPSPDALYYLGGAAAGAGLVAQANHLFGDGSPKTAAIAMLAHSLAEGAGLGLLVGSPGFPAIFRSQVIHGVPDGMLVALVSLERAGLARATFSALLSRSGQAGAFYAMAVYAPRISEEALWVAEGVALGSLAAVAWEELLKPAVCGLGWKRVALVAASTAVACQLALGQ